MLLSLLVALQILSTNCKPDAGYNIFPGFQNFDEGWGTSENTTEDTIELPAIHKEPVSKPLEDRDHVYLAPRKKKHHRSRSKWFNLRTVGPTSSMASTTGNGTLEVTTTPKLKAKFTCPEQERPSNIGPYEVPTKRDLVLLTIKTLHRLFSSYQRKTMVFLDDINQVVIATEEVESHCVGQKVTYRQCVKHVRSKCEIITKALMSSLEQQRQDVIAFGKVANTICSIEEMSQDPVKLIKILASEQASLEFALPGFLRLLNTCSNYCISPISDDKFKAVKPSRHLTDTDVVIRHFLTKKNYKRLLAPVMNRGAFNIPILDKRKPKI